MSRLQLRPALRAYAHAPAGVEAAFANTSSTDLDGIDDGWEGDAATTVGTTGAGAFSISLWVKLNSFAASFSGMASIVPSDIAASYVARRAYIMIRNNGAIYVRTGNGVSSLASANTSPGVISLGTWYHIAYTAPGGAGTNVNKLYLDGAEVLTHNGKALSSSAVDQIPMVGLLAQSGAYRDFSDGLLDEVAYWDLELSAGAIADIHNSGLPADLTDISPVHWYRCGDLTDTVDTLIDQGSGGIDADKIDAPAFSADVPWTPASISGLLLWLDPSDAAAVTTSGSDVIAIADKMGPHSFAYPSYYKFVYTAITDPTTGAQGNGLNFMQNSLANTHAVSTLTFIPSGGTLGDTNTGNVGEEWTNWFVAYAETGYAQNFGSTFRRGGDGRTSGGGATWAKSPTGPAFTANIFYTQIHDEWSNEASLQENWTVGAKGYQDPSGKTVAFYIQSYDDGGTMKYRWSQDGGATWPHSWAHGRTPATSHAGSVGSVYNVWTLEGRPWGSTTYQSALGESGFINGAASASDLLTLHTYLTDKWDLDI